MSQELREIQAKMEALRSKWAPLIEHADLPKVKDSYRKQVLAVMLENTAKAFKDEQALLTEAAPTNSLGGFPASGPVKGYDPVLISLVRRAMPNLMAFDIAGVQPMTMPTGLIFAIRSRYTSQAGGEALFNEADTDFSGAGTHSSGHPADPAATRGTAMTTLNGEKLGTAGEPAFAEMAFSIDKIPVSVGTRALKAEYSIELQQDLKAVHGLDAEAELANILSSEILAEINREIVRLVYAIARPGAQAHTTTAGVFDLDTDSNGRWLVERVKGLMLQLDFDSNEIAKETRRGKGNILICSSNVASALSAATLLDTGSNLKNDLAVDDTGNTFVGVLNGKHKVFVDPYAISGTDYAIVGYKGSSAFDAGVFYCPYVPLQMMRAVDPGSFQPKIGFKTRYGLVSNPFATAAGDGSLTNGANFYYRKIRIDNLM